MHRGKYEVHQGNYKQSFALYHISDTLRCCLISCNRKIQRKKLSIIIRSVSSGLGFLVVIISLVNFLDGSNPVPSPDTTSEYLPKTQSIITMGSFEQDNNVENDAEPIEWLVLGTNANNEVLLVSRFGLLYKPYEESDTAKEWKECSLRKWLNEDFYPSAFSDDEIACIVFQQDLLTEKSSTYYSSADDSYSNDYVFCLSTRELEQYFQPRESRVCKPTPYAETTFAGDTIHPNGDHWWLRNPGFDLSNITCVRGEGQPNEKPGTVNEYGSHSNGGGTLVRPAMWISWDSYISLSEQNQS